MTPRLVFVGLALTALTACASAPARQGPVDAAAGGPLLWRADRPQGDGSLFLFGSVHFGTPESFDFAAVSRAWARSDEVVVEVDLSRLSPQDAAQATLRYGTLPEGESLEALLSPETWSALVEQLEARGIPLAAFSRFKPWFAAMTLASLQLRSAGLEPEYGVDTQLIGRASGDKPIVELESLDSQLRLLDSLSPQVQELMLEETLAKGDQQAFTSRIVEAWRRGDEQELLALFFGSIDEHPEFETLYEKVYFERNEAMSRRLAELSRDGKTRFTVLGAGHMLGPRGIPSLLEEHGFRVERVR